MPQRALLVSLMLFAGCNKKTATDYYQAKSTYEVLVATEGDDAFGDPRLARIEATLATVPRGTEEHPLALALLAKIASEKRRVADENAPPPRAPPEAPSPSTGFFADRDRAAEQVRRETEASNNPPPLVTGMTEAELLKHHGRCVSRIGELEVPPEKAAGVGYQAVASAECQARLKVPAGDVTLFLVGGQFVKWMQRVEEQVTLDAGLVTSTTTVEIDGGTVQRMVMPGMPIPDGYTGVPGAPQQ